MTQKTIESWVAPRRGYLEIGIGDESISLTPKQAFHFTEAIAACARFVECQVALYKDMSGDSEEQE